MVGQVVRKYSSTSRELIAGALFDIAAMRGLDAASVREVATTAGVSIGAVQHHFATKDDMFAFAFRHLVDRVQARMENVNPADPLERRLVAALSELLPLDDERAREATVMAGFATRAATSDQLGAIQRETLTLIRTGFADVLRAAGLQHPARNAMLLLAVADGLALDAISSAGLYDNRELTTALKSQVRMVIAHA